MPVRHVVALPDAVLKQRATAVGGPDEALARDLVDTMHVSPGCVGLAAPQIGVSSRAFCLDVSGHPKGSSKHGLVVLFDPELVHAEGSEVAREGCMSVPHFTANVRRAISVVVRGVDAQGRECLYEVSGFEARAFQHELDHLDGLLILDRVASLSTDVFRRKVYQPPRPQP
ncbi:MAG: peptide deformylase [Nitriliruptorales bacterium]|nr:peptide deformylase [Nitriliruptorales bacterium]